ncbi:glutaredoxin family protein [Nocardia terpenica]|uniref:NrdH-redoxin n=1 Tax=Nocardia terpenica TaxID=455432 RepID=A0A291RTZ2_9NOCA|nr:glutaredoxin family protein [Nocardia terpenica]ATL70749.1 NrdH-redoxin [Nocardia terpenica]
MTDEYHHDITVYVKDDCQPCKATKIYLLKHSVPFTEVNISQSPLVREALIEQGYSSVPIVEWNVDGNTGSWTGFRPENIEELALLLNGGT